MVVDIKEPTDSNPVSKKSTALETGGRIHEPRKSILRPLKIKAFLVKNFTFCNQCRDKRSQSGNFVCREGARKPVGKGGDGNGGKLLKRVT